MSKAARVPDPGEVPEVAPVVHRLPDPDDLRHPTVGERIARGRDARTRVPLGVHAQWTPPADRTDPIAVLERQAAARMADLVPIRYGRMVASPFAFYRGGAAIMAADLACTRTSGITTQLCGDAHLMNFGFFATPARTLVFDINDFDETLPGPWEWDVKRLAASLDVAGRDLGLAEADRRAAVLAAVRCYREQMSTFAEMGNLEVWHTRLPAEKVRDELQADASKHERKHLDHDLGKALRKNHLGAFHRLVAETDGEPRFVSEPPLVVPVEELLDDDARRRYVTVVRGFLGQYRASLSHERRHLVEQYRYVHMARKVVGVGSVGTRAWVVLMVGRDVDDPLILQLKEAKRSVLEPYAGPSPFKDKGRRVVEGQQLMQAAGDPLLGWYRLRAFDDRMHDFYVRQLWDGKASVDVTAMSASGLRHYASSCGWTLARAHARSGDRIAIAAYLGEGDRFDEAIADFAAAYADTNEADHARLAEAVADGRLEATLGV